MAQQTQPLKILAIGSPLSALSATVSKMTAINSKHGPFDACVLVGDVFSEGSDGSEATGLIFPVPTYFTLGKYPLPESIISKIGDTGGEVTTNLVFLGKSTVLTTAQGLKIACVGGSYSEDTYNSAADSSSATMTRDSVNSVLNHPLLSPNNGQSDSTSFASAKSSATALPSAYQGIDLLLLSSPPPHLSALSTSFPTSGISLASQVPSLEEVVRNSRPRYLFWADGDGFWEREPWGWAGSSGKDERWTRAVKLGALGGDAPEGGKKARWFYAFSLPPQTPSTPLPTKPANATPCPFITLPNASDSSSSGKKRPAPDGNYIFGGDQKKGRTEGGPPPESYVCKICSQPGHWIQDCPQKTVRDHNKPPPGYVCKICQSTEHLIRDCPNKQDQNRNAQGHKLPPQGYVCRACGVENAHFIRDCPVVLEREGQKQKKKELGPAECWFCLSNPKVTKHLITAIGSETYVTLPKGQLIPTLPRHVAQGGAKPLVPGGGHVLIIPIAHHPTLLSIPAEDAMSIISELENFKSSLRACYASYGAVPVVFEVGRLSGRGGHAHVQVIPVPKELAEKVEESFRSAGEKQGLDWEVEPERALAKVGPAGNYFKVECPDGKKLVHLLKGGFDLQFGRVVLGSLMGLHHRIDWKECSQTEQEEKDDALKFKKAFAPFHT